MERKLLQRFYNDEPTRKVLYNYLIEIYSKVAVERAFNRQPVEHLADAKEVLDRAYSELAKEFGTRETKEEVAPR
jgi:hypothetical protein